MNRNIEILEPRFCVICTGISLMASACSILYNVSFLESSVNKTPAPGVRDAFRDLKE